MFNCNVFSLDRASNWRNIVNYARKWLEEPWMQIDPEPNFALGACSISPQAYVTRQKVIELALTFKQFRPAPAAKRIPKATKKPRGTAGEAVEEQSSRRDRSRSRGSQSASASASASRTKEEETETKEEEVDEAEVGEAEVAGWLRGKRERQHPLAEDAAEVRLGRAVQHLQGADPTRVQDHLGAVRGHSRGIEPLQRHRDEAVKLDESSVEQCRKGERALVFMWPFPPPV